FNITTVDTFVWDTLKLNTKKIKRIKEGKEFGYDFLTQATILNSLVFFDEAHYVIEDEMMREAFGIVLNFLFSLRVPIIVSSATIPQSHKEVFEWFARQNEYTFKTFEPRPSDPYIERERSKRLTIDFKLIKPFEPKSISSIVSESTMNLVIMNTVKKAVDVYNSLEAKYTGKKLLLHGKMKPSHRKQILDKLENLKNKPFILVCTQVVEAGVDISSNNLVTELAPPNQLIQRMGRVARYEEESAKITIINTGESSPYNEYLLQESYRWLEINKQTFHPRLPELYQPFLETVYKGATNLKSSLCRHRKVVNSLLDLRTRSNEILDQIEQIIRREGFLRRFSLPVSVDGEIILFDPKEVEKLYNKGEIELQGYSKQERPDFYQLAKLLALGKRVDLTYTGHYDEEKGIVVWE
ncbi:MAG: CRISPR-associated helicase Cas3', partial [Methanobacteriaceae archaeon]|nr:CRISPR-associated helicase Cas3' [Methanobacteriaceae archaeon]